jgi:radical SAM superfamily enzyme YgiQ (UPF0313 family)
MKAVLISTYELGRQPFGLASPAAWLRREGIDVTCLDVSRQSFDESIVRDADLVAFYLPMHTATRLSLPLLKQVAVANPRAHICAYGLYAPLNSDLLRLHGARTIFGGEFETSLTALARQIALGVPVPENPDLISLPRQQFVVPSREGLPALDQYAQLTLPDGTKRVVGYTEASRGCKHLCRHCPIVPVYGGTFRIVQREVVLADIRAQVAVGAAHITFGDPDFLNGVKHATDLLRAFHAEFPDLSYDVTIKIEHLLRHREVLPLLATTGCAFITSAVEAVDDEILKVFDKHHTRADFVEAVRACGEAGVALVPTFVAFNPWISVSGYAELLETLVELDLVDSIAPVQLSIRLLIPAGSRLLELPDVRQLVGPYDATALVYPWRHPDPAVDELQRTVEKIVHDGLGAGATRRMIFDRVRHHTWHVLGQQPPSELDTAPDRTQVPYLNEPWYC